MSSELKPCSPSLKAITAASTRRYSISQIILPSHRIITAGVYSYGGEPRPQYLPPGWSPYINPEGQQYFFRMSELRIVTEECLFRADVLEQICYWTRYFEELLMDRGVALSPNVELYLELDSTTDTCLYYFIDHSTRTEFWLEELSSEDLELPESVSESHLRFIFEEHYWSHVEHFPMHFKGLPRRVIDDLISTFAHGCLDQITSSSSPFPYSRSECDKFMKLLKSSRCTEQITDGNTVFTVARLWGVISYHRFNTRYGQENVRLCREQGLLGFSPLKRGWLYTMCSQMLWHYPNLYATKFEQLYTDNIVYGNHWTAFMRTCLEDWKLLITWSFALLLADLLMMQISPSRFSLALPSTLLCAGTILSAVGLFMHHRDQPEAVSSTEAALYLENVQSETSEFNCIGLIFALPKSLFIWGLVLFAVQCVMFAFGCGDARVAAGLVGLIFCVANLARNSLNATGACNVFAIWRQIWNRSSHVEDELPRYVQCASVAT